MALIRWDFSLIFMEARNLAKLDHRLQNSKVFTYCRWETEGSRVFRAPRA